MQVEVEWVSEVPQKETHVLTEHKEEHSRTRAMDTRGFDLQCSQLSNGFPPPIHTSWQLLPDLHLLPGEAEGVNPWLSRD